jgi:preprotein translocase subunit SecE
LGVQVPPALLQEVITKILKVKKVPTKKGKTVSVNSTERLGLFSRMSLFLRQVMFELKKVVWPTKEQMVTYTAVVVVFVIIMGLIIAALDFLFVKLVLLVFG